MGTGKALCTVDLTMGAKDDASAMSLINTMTDADRTKFMSGFRGRADVLGKKLAPAAKVEDISGSTQESQSKEQLQAAQALSEAKHNVNNVTSEATLAKQASLMAIEKAEETKANFLTAQTKHDDLLKAKRDIETAAVEASDKAKTEKKEGMGQETSMKKADAQAQELAKSAAKTATDANAARAEQEALQSKLQIEQDKQNALGQELDEAATKRASANVAAQNAKQEMKDAEEELARLLGEKKQ